MKLGEAISKVEELMTIGCLFDVTESGSRIQAAFDALRTYEEGGTQMTHYGAGGFLIVRDPDGSFQPSEAFFEMRGGNNVSSSQTDSPLALSIPYKHQPKLPNPLPV